jgi:hypothetical protein
MAETHAIERGFQDMADGSQKPALTAEQMRDQRLQRNLKILVVVLGLMMLATMGAIALKIFGSSKGAATVSGNTPAIASSAAGELAVEIPAGAKIVSTSLSGGQLSVHYEGPRGAGIAIVDLASGRKILDVKPMQAIPKN